MRSATSCFNPTLYVKNLSRFWPLWGLYTLIWAFILPLNLLNQALGRHISADSLLELAQELPSMLSIGMVGALVFGVFSAMAVFSYLYSSRSACAMHALPLRREALFCTNYLSGLSFLVLPNLLIALFTLCVELCIIPAASWSAVLPAVGVWLALQSGMCLFFYSFAVFCAMFTGHILALPVFYGILNVLVFVISDLIRALCGSFLFGYENAGSELVEWFTPAWKLSNATYGYWDTPAGSASQAYLLKGPGVVAVYAVVGLVLTFAALEVYKFRHVESAGDVVSVALVRPVFKYGVAFCSGLCFGLATAIFFDWEGTLSLTACVLVWSVIGYFVAEMFLKKSFRVFKAWKGAAVIAAVMALLCAALFMDWFGYEDRVPQASDVACVDISGLYSAPYDSASSFGTTPITDPDQIAALVDLHRAVVYEHSHPAPSQWTDSSLIRLRYTLKNGGVLSRSYSLTLREDDLEREGTVTWAVDRLLQDRDLVALAYGFDKAEGKKLESAELSRYFDPETGKVFYHGGLENIPQSRLPELWHAVLADFDEGTIGVRYPFTNSDQRWENTYSTDLLFTFRREIIPNGATQSSYQDVTVTLTPQASHTLDWLTENGVLNEHCQLIPQDAEYDEDGTLIQPSTKIVG